MTEFGPIIVVERRGFMVGPPWVSGASLWTGKSGGAWPAPSGWWFSKQTCDGVRWWEALSVQLASQPLPEIRKRALTVLTTNSKEP